MKRSHQAKRNPLAFALIGAGANELAYQLNAYDVEGNLTRSCILESGSEVSDWNGGGLHAPANVGENSGPECFIMLQAEGGEFVRAEPAEPTGGEDGYNCDPANVADLEGDFSSGG